MKQTAALVLSVIALGVALIAVGISLAPFEARELDFTLSCYPSSQTMQEIECTVKEMRLTGGRLLAAE